MNVVLQYLDTNWHRLALHRFGDPGRLSCVVETPRFHTSGHIIFFVVSENTSRPLFIAKVPRIPNDTARLDREASNLHALQAARSGGFSSVPKLVAYEQWSDCRLLLETAVPGQPINPKLVRTNTRLYIDGVVDWLATLQMTTRGPADAKWAERLLLQPLLFLEQALSAEQQNMLAETQARLMRLQKLDLPLVFEHGDLSHPNLLLSDKGEVGVVDWELAEPKGLPATDLFFFLTYIAFAKQRARDTVDYLAAFHRAFFGPGAWARPYIDSYATQIGLSAEMLNLLFLACWARYVAGLVARITSGNAGRLPLDGDQTEWLLSNRFFLLWRYTLEHERELNLTG